MRTVYPTIAKTLLVGLWFVCLYRAITQSIVHDEALTWQLYIDAPIAQIFQVFDANHHFLNTVLMRLCAGVFGASEWSLRLPALAGAALYFAAVYRLARTAFGSGLTFLLAVAALTLNPFILDFMVAARGYGLALALYVWPLGTLMRLLSASGPLPRKDLLIAGIALALSVTANLVFILPAVFLALTFVILTFRPVPEPKASRKKAAKPLPQNPVWRWFVLPFVCVGVLFFMLAPFSNATQASFYAGASSISESLRSLASVSLEHGGPFRASPIMHVCRDIAAFVLAPGLLLAGVWIGVRRRDTVLLLVAIPAAASGLAWFAMHWIADLPYPMDRTGIYFAPLVTIVLMRIAALATGPKAMPLRMASVSAYAIAAAAVVLFALQFDTRKFAVWEYDSDTRQLALEIANRRTPNAQSVRVGGSWQLEPSLNFYRARYNWTWMEPVRRQAQDSNTLDFYALIPQDRDSILKLGLHELWQGPVSHTILASAH
jgi:hypothetical protein